MKFVEEDLAALGIDKEPAHDRDGDRSSYVQPRNRNVKIDKMYVMVMMV